jgi:hypothetical protein
LVGVTSVGEPVLVVGVAVRPAGPRALAAPRRRVLMPWLRRGGEDDAAGAVLRRLLPGFSANARGVITRAEAGSEKSHTVWVRHRPPQFGTTRDRPPVCSLAPGSRSLRERLAFRRSRTDANGSARAHL